MKHILLAFGLLPALFPAAYGQGSSPFTLYVHDTTGKLPDTPLPSIYQLTSMQIGSSSPTLIKMVNTSANTVYLRTALVSTSATSTTSSANFSVIGVFQDQLMVPGASVLYTINFTPTVTGMVIGYLNLDYQVLQNGCIFSGTGAPICPVNLSSVSTLNGAGTAPQFTLSYQSAGGPVVLTPSSSSPLNFPNTSLSSTSSIAFTLANASTGDLTVPAISLPVTNLNEPSAFSLDVSSVPATIAAGQSANFVVTFTPSQASLASAALQVGSNSYSIQGFGVAVATIDALDISYTDLTGVQTVPQAATPISFGQIILGSGASPIFRFAVFNPITSANPVTIPAITASGIGFELAVLPALPAVVAPGDSLTFNLGFAPLSIGNFTGSLSIGNRSFSLTGLSLSPAIPSLSITSSGTIGSNQQLSLTVQTNAPSPVSALGTLTLQFTPSIANVTEDAAVVFVATNGRQLKINLAAGAQLATYNGQSGIAFQTGTTAGTITFSVAFPDTTTYTKSFTIPSAVPKIASAQAIRESSNLVVTLVGYDNTYSAGELSFTFYDTSGKAIGNAISYSAESNFQQLFFTDNPDGGMFSLQATFPVTGDVTKVGSVAATLGSSIGQSTSNASFQ